MTELIDSIRSEYVRYKSLAEAAIRQLSEPQLAQSAQPGDNSIATICWHVSGNLHSRFSEFRSSDGEKPWRDREREFEPRAVSQRELMTKWELGWSALFSALDELTDAMLDDSVTIRQSPLKVHEALHRSLAHTSYHVGQIVYIAKALRGSNWQYLSIPPGQSAAYNQNPGRERPEQHAAGLSHVSGPDSQQ